MHSIHYQEAEYPVSFLVEGGDNQEPTPYASPLLGRFPNPLQRSSISLSPDPSSIWGLLEVGFMSSL
ncbi:hypothetical protein L1987_24803 [Smallanthus sonchifolius]|uniref:Uncharacterized protein n=1 Tax=Smallanthus sonchifolius TaxID=185202 RepID=A0ACB9IMX5_9ASTR|nr:hypothetical protein L1987_24803 [Smallanthus sonchifolius]